ncbi:MAG TPA: SDR family oxidoreductase [Candidatus Thalassarchaeaceae archaeon]|nr:SDR family oxidoreductase [Candidatus Thalassarchaeaceae archaeon]
MGVALVTGGARRIGAEICRNLAASGHSVIIHYNTSKLESEALAEELQKISKIATIQADLGDQNECNDLLAKATQFFGPISILINNASFFEYDNLESFNADTFMRSIEVNTLSPLVLIKAFASQVPEGGGCIINMLDQKLHNPNPDYLSYTTSKTAIAGMTESLAIGLAPSIRVNGLAPGLTLPSPHAPNSKFEELHNSTPLARGSTPEDISEAVLYLVAAKAVTGQVLFVDGGERLSPRDSDVLFGRGE